jgi:hypothetical protein
MSGTPRRKRLLLSASRAPIQPNCKLTLVLTVPLLISRSLARLTDENLAMVPLLPEFFPQMPITALIHAGFGIEHIRYVTCSPLVNVPHPTKTTRRAASVIFSNVTQTLATYGASTVTITGHSLGAALALLEGVQLRIQLDASVDVRVIGYGMPRVGNKNFAKWVDSHLGGKVTHINNQQDPIPILPSEFLGYVHPSGEVHIQDSGDWLSCPGEPFFFLACYLRPSERTLTWCARAGLRFRPGQSFH